MIHLHLTYSIYMHIIHIIQCCFFTAHIWYCPLELLGHAWPSSFSQAEVSCHSHLDERSIKSYFLSSEVVCQQLHFAASVNIEGIL